MCANVPQQRLEHRPDDAAEDHSPAQPGAVCKATFHISVTTHCVFRDMNNIFMTSDVIIQEMSRNTFLKCHLLGYSVKMFSVFR